uniref:DUF2283 domain-containing protein n=1 Tax=Candidatus Kentrum sp. FW TaxID=2126338 RepID=A0A450THJ1_9GAMM|nr:MAG: Protein of unknown function (DUF2283) [Candidatus Kentron sp. FW]
MRVRIDHEADAVYINLTDHGIEDSEEVADGVIVDYDPSEISLAWRFSMPPGKPAIPIPSGNSVSIYPGWRPEKIVRRDMAMDTEVTLTNQPRGIRLEFRVIAVNKAGEGEPSDGESS